MELLTCINNILPYLGESPVTKVDLKHPTVSIIVDALNQARQALLSRGWWFNTRVVKLYPSQEGDMPSPKDALFVETLDKDLLVEMRGRSLYDLKNGTYKFKEPIEVKLIEDLDFEILPLSASLWIQYRACAQVYTKDFGVEDILKEITAREQEAMISLQSEHLRKVDYKTLKKRLARKYYHAIRG